MESFLLALIAGLGAGGMYAMVGVGLVVAFRGSGVINFAHGAVAGYSAFTFDELREPGSGGRAFLPWPTFGFLPNEFSIGEAPSTIVAIIVAVLMAGLIGLLMHLLVFRPLRNAPTLAKVIGSVGVMLYLASVILINFGNANRADTGFWRFTTADEPIKNFLGLGDLPSSNLYLAGAAIVMGGLVWALYTFTRFGISTRAADENEKGAALLGYSPQLIAGVNWVLASMLAGLAGVFFLHKTQPSLFLLFVVPALGAALFGNMTSILGATAGGLLIGMAASGGVELAEQSWWPDWLPGDGVRNTVPLLVIILVLFLRGDKLPVRGSISAGRQPRAPETKNLLIGLGVAGGIGVLLSNIFTSNWESTLTTTLISMLFMFSLVVLVGYLGQISLVQWSLAGAAGFIMIRLVADGSKIRQNDFFINTGPGWPQPIAVVVAVGLALVIGVLVGLPALRIRGVQLAVVTLSAVIALEDLIIRNESLLGEGAKSTNPTPKPSWFGVYIGAENPVGARTDYWRYTAVLLGLVALVGVAITNLRRGAIGRRFLAVRANERAAAAAGINVAQTKLLGFAISSAIAGMAGIMLAYKLPAISSDNFSVFTGLALLAFVYLGGITTTFGAVVGGCLVAGGLVPEFIGLHFEGVDTAYINTVGAIGLIFNAIMTNGEGIALLQSGQAKHILDGLRRPPADEPAIDLTTTTPSADLAGELV